MREHTVTPGSTPKRPALNRAAAIREQCLECMGYQRVEINRCPDRACPLWEWRRGPGGKERTETPLRRQSHTKPLPKDSDAISGQQTLVLAGIPDKSGEGWR